MLDGEELWLTETMLPGELTIAEQIERSGAPQLLLEHYEGRLEYHEPWHVAREVSHLFRGLVDAVEADRLLAEHGHGDLRLVDNGAVSRRSPALAALPQVRGYHLLPAAASKAKAVAAHRRARGYGREETFAVGDSREDLACAQEVGVFWLVANALTRDPTLREAIASAGNVKVAEQGHGEGVYEAVLEHADGGLSRADGGRAGAGRTGRAAVERSAPARRGLSAARHPGRGEHVRHRGVLVAAVAEQLSGRRHQPPSRRLASGSAAVGHPGNYKPTVGLIHSTPLELGAAGAPGRRPEGAQT